MAFSIDLCVPAYLAEQHLPILLESASKQNPPFNHIIVCVDASPDNSAEVARAHGATVIVNESNLGCSGSKNQALKHATSEWVHFLDADDELLPNFTAVAKRESERQKEVDVILMAHEYRDHKTNLLLGTNPDCDVSIEDPLRFFIKNIYANFGIYKRELLNAVGGFDTDPAVLYNEDTAFHIRMALTGCVFGVSTEISAISWRYGESMSASHPIKCLLAQHAVMRNTSAAVGEQYLPDIAERLWEIATGFARHKKWSMLREVLDEARSLYPEIPEGQSSRFRLLVRLLGAYRAFVVREHFIRLFKPHLRKSGS